MNIIPKKLINPCANIHPMRFLVRMRIRQSKTPIKNADKMAPIPPIMCISPNKRLFIITALYLGYILIRHVSSMPLNHSSSINVTIPI